MAAKNIKSNTLNYPLKLLLTISLIITIYFGTQLQDPFNAPKMAILLVLSAGLIPYLFEKRNDSYRLNMTERILIYSLTAGLTLSTLLTDNKYIGIFGESQRKIGFLTYLCFIIIFTISLKFFNLNNFKSIYTALFMLSCILTIYGLLQTTGNDPVKWNNQYNSIITVFGNPNFASAFFAMLSVAMLAKFFYEKIISLKLMNLTLVFFMILLIWRSQSRQGLVSFSIGAAVILTVVLSKRKRVLGIFASILFATLLILAVLGMLQIGPLTSLLYKDSVSVRGFYWRAAIEMFFHNPFSGIGIDRYGSYFKEFREIGYPLNYGYNLTSTNAHNVYLQLLATGGLSVAIPYIALKIYIAWSGIKYLLNSQSKHLVLFTGLFACWTAYEAQSLISIDNIGLTIWGWILGGAILALSKQNKVLTSTEQVQSLSNNKKSYINLVSYFMIIPSTIFALYFIKGESEMWKARVLGESSGFQPSEELKNLTSKAVNTPLLDPIWKIMCADYFAQMGDLESGSNLIEEILKKDSRNIDALQVGARIYAARNETELAIKLQVRISEIDPYNAENYYVLLKNYKLIGDFDNAKFMREKIKQVAPNSEQFRLAIDEISAQENN